MKLEKPFHSNISQTSRNVISFLMNGRNIWKHASRTGKTHEFWKSYSEHWRRWDFYDFHDKNRVCSRPWHIKLQLWGLWGVGRRLLFTSSPRQNGRARQRCSKVFLFISSLFFSWLPRQFLDVVNVIISNPWRSMKIHVGFGDSGTVFYRENPNVPQHRWISISFQLGYQGGMYLSNEKHDDFLASCWNPNRWLLGFFKVIDKFGADNVNNWNMPTTELCIHNNAEP